MHRKPIAGIGFALLTVLALTPTLVACGSKDTSVNASSTSSNSAMTSSTTTIATTSSTPPSGTQASVPATSPKRYLTDVKASRTDGKDIIQFTFNDGTPGYSAEYVTPPITDEGEGNAVTVNGENVLKLAFESSGTVDLTGGAKTYYNGPARISPTDTTTISEVVKVSEYEGRLLFGIGTHTKAPFTITSNGNIVTLTFN